MGTKTITVAAVARNENRDGYWGVKVGDDWMDFEKKPSFKRGAKVKIRTNADGIVTQYKVESEGSSNSGGGSGRRGGGGGYKADPEKEKRIVAQHSQEMGIAAAALILEHDAEKLGAKTKPAERKATIMSLIDECTTHFYNGAFDQGFLEAAKDVDDDLDDDLGDDDEDDMDDDVWDD